MVHTTVLNNKQDLSGGFHLGCLFYKVPQWSQMNNIFQGCRVEKAKSQMEMFLSPCHLAKGSVSGDVVDEASQR